MKRTISLWLLSFYIIPVFAQFRLADSLKLLLQKEKQDTNRVLLLANIGISYIFEKPETGLTYVEQGLELSRAIEYKKGEVTCLNALGHLNRMIGNYNAGIQYHLQALQICEMINDQSGVAASYFGIAGNYEDERDYKEALLYYYKIKPVAESLSNVEVLGGLESSMGLCFLNLGQLDSALKYEQNAYELQINSQGKAIALARLGSIHTAMNNDDVALSFYKMGLPIAIANSDNNALTELYSGIFTLFQKRQQYDSCIYYSKKELATAQEFGSPGAIAAAYSDLFTSYKKNNITDSALKYLELAAVTKDTLITQEKIKQQQMLAFQEKSASRRSKLNLQLLPKKENRTFNMQLLPLELYVLFSCFFYLAAAL